VSLQSLTRIDSMFAVTATTALGLFMFLLQTISAAHQRRARTFSAQLMRSLYVNK
jgi:hypothetical protein